MSRDQVIQETIGFVKEKLAGDSSGHDWWHIYRVWNLSKRIYETEGGDLFVIELAALLHDVADWKFHEDEKEGLKLIETWLKTQGLENELINKVLYIIANVSYKGSGVKDKMETIEGKIVQDADRLDAIGAIGIARTFAFGGKFGNEMHNPNVEIVMHENFEQYKKSNGTTINHFYEKLLLLKDRINTEAAKKIANERHLYMESFLQQFYAEWESVK
jgi:uncharacterized protein